MKTLICLGDSWPQGGELNNQSLAYGHLIKKQLNFDLLYNYGQGGASNEDSLYQFSNYMEKHYNAGDLVTVIVHLTNPARSILWPDRENWVNGQPENLRSIFLHFHEYDDFRSSLVVSTLQSWCKKYNFNDFYFSGWVKYKHWLPAVDTSKIWKTGQETASNWFGLEEHNGEHLVECRDNPYIKPNICHPNELGHQLISDKLCSWISQKQ